MVDEIRAPQRPVSVPQRMTASLAERRWFSFLVELILIVAGILIALYIDGWMQDRRDRDTETAYLSLLVEDLKLIEASLQEYAEFESGNIDRAAATYRAIAEQNLPADSAALRRMLSGLGQRQTLNIVSAAYTDLTSTGNLRLIRDQDLRSSIVQLFDQIERAELIIEKNNNAFVDGVFLNFLLSFGITPVAETASTALVTESDHLVVEALGEDARLPADDILSRPAGSRSWDDLRRQVYFRMRIAGVGVVLADQTLSAANALRFEIDAALASRDSH